MYRVMAVSTRPPRLEFAHDGANPTLETIEYVRAILRAPETPISRNEVLRMLAAWGHSTTRRTLNAAIAFLGADGNVAEGSKGLIWLSEPSAKLVEAARHAVPLR
jgi:hypothetical protein